MKETDLASVESSSDPQATERVADDLSCAKCGYNLRSLRWDAKCPECGLEVSRSRMPAGFRFGDWKNIKRARLGLCVLVISATAQIVHYLTHWICQRWLIFDYPSVARPVWLVLKHTWIVPTLIGLVGLALVTSGLHFRRPRYRPLLGLTILVFAVIGLLSARLQFVVLPAPRGPVVADLFFLLPGLCFPLSHVLLYWYLLLLVVRPKERGLWRSMCFAVLGSTAILFNELVDVAFWACDISWHVVRPGSRWHELYMWVSDYAFSEPKRYVAQLSKVLILIAVWMFYRRLSAALRVRIGQGS